MLAVRVIPTLLARGHQLVKGKQFQSWRSVGHVMQAAKIHQARGVDELIILDIAATPAGRGPDFAFVELLTAECLMPLTIGGGVRSVADVKRLLACGADKVAICTAALRSPQMVMECCQQFGKQAIVLSVDFLETGGPTSTAVMSECGQQAWMFPGHDSARAGVLWWIAGAAQHVGEILLTSIDREGTMDGYDIDLIREVSQAVSIPVIAHGGCAGYNDMLNAVRAGASAVAAGALFQFTDATPKGAAQYLAEHGVETRVTA